MRTHPPKNRPSMIVSPWDRHKTPVHSRRSQRYLLEIRDRDDVAALNIERDAGYCSAVRVAAESLIDALGRDDEGRRSPQHREWQHTYPPQRLVRPSRSLHKGLPHHESSRAVSKPE